MQAIPEDAINDESDDEDKSNPDERISIRASDKRIAPDNEYSDSEDEGDSRREQRSFKGNRKRPRTESSEGGAAVAAGLETKSDEKEEVTKNINGEKDKDAKESEKRPEAAKAVTETSSTSPEETKEERVTSTESSSPSVAAPTDTSKGDKPT